MSTAPVEPPTVAVEDVQDEHPVDIARWELLATHALGAEGVTGPALLSITFVDEATIAELNAEHLGIDGPTDVLSFPIDDDPDQPLGPGQHPTRLLGDIVICPTVAARNAPDHAGTVDDELALLVVHGVLHVLGHDHADVDEALEMRRREAALLERFHGPVSAGTEIPTRTDGPATATGAHVDDDPGAVPG